MLFKDFSIFSSDGHFVQRSRTIQVILVEVLVDEILFKEKFTHNTLRKKTNHNSSP